MDIREESLKKHYEWKGKISIKANVKADTAEALALAYTPGVAEPCLAIKEDINKSFEFSFDFKASGCTDIFKVDATERALKKFDCSYYFINVLTTYAQGNCIDIAVFFKEKAFTFHYGHTCFRTDITKTEYRSTVCDNSNCIPSSCKLEGFTYILFNCKARLCNTGGIRKGKCLCSICLDIRLDGDFTLPFVVFFK